MTTFKKARYILFFIILMEINIFAQQYTDTLIYIGDPMCSWCYGFTPELDKIKQKFPNMHFEMIMGGLRVDGEEPLEDLKELLTDEWKAIGKLTGRPFNYGILQKNEFYYNTEPACRSVAYINRFFPDKSYKYFKALQSAFYQENQNPTEIATFISVMQKMRLPTEDFEKKFRKIETRNLVQSDFLKSSKLGVQAFPSLIAIINGKFYKISNGYATSEKVIAILKDRMGKY